MQGSRASINVVVVNTCSIYVVVKWKGGKQWCSEIWFSDAEPSDFGWVPDYPSLRTSGGCMWWRASKQLTKEGPHDETMHRFQGSHSFFFWIIFGVMFFKIFWLGSRVTCVFPDPRTKLFPWPVRPKATVWLDDLAKRILSINKWNH